MFDWDWPGAESEYKRALGFDPGYATALHRYGIYLYLMARFQEALTHLETARRLDPTSLIINADIGLADYLAGRSSEAIVQLRKTLDMEPDFIRAHAYLVDCYVQARRFEEAIAEARKVLEVSGNPSAKTLLSYSYAAAGRKTEARLALASFNARSEERFAQPLSLAATYALLNEKDRAFEVLEMEYGERAYGILRLGVDPKVNVLRSDSRFQTMLRRLGLNR